MVSPAEQFFISSSYSRIIARVLGLQERDLQTLLSGTGLPQEVLLPGDETRLSGPQQLRILQNARRLSGDPALGLRLGQHLQPSAHGPIGYLALSSPDLVTALKNLRDFLPLRIAFARLELAFSGPWLACDLRLGLDAPPDEERMLLECFALLLQALVESVLGAPLTDARFEFAFAAPDYRPVYRDYLHSPTLFSRDGNRLLLPGGLARAANTAGDPVSYGLARDLCEKLLAQVPATSLSMTSRVRRLLLTMPPGATGEAEVARALFVTPRTLARRLKREGTGFREIRAQLLAEMSAQYLRESDLSVESIAALLGYHDAANFRRAFRRWFGQAPATFRGDRRKYGSMDGG